MKSTLPFLLCQVAVAHAAALLHVPISVADTDANANAAPDLSTKKVCSIEGTFAVVNCRVGPGRDFSSVRTVAPGQSFSVQCMRDGESIDGEKYVFSIPFHSMYNCGKEKKND